MAQKIYPEKLQNLYKLSILGSSMGKLWEVTAETRAIPKLQDPILIEGLPGIGNVGKIAVDFMVGELKAKRLYSFFSYRFPHSVFVNSKTWWICRVWKYIISTGKEIKTGLIISRRRHPAHRRRKLL